LAKRLISGVDIWLNTPTRPLEASGTSGQKAEMNGVLNFSVLDGWWLEGYVKGAGWAITDKNTYQNSDFQDQLDAVTIYSMLENEIIPLYFDRKDKPYSPEWVMYIKNSIAKIAPHFTTKRMLDDYIDKFYKKLSNRSAYLSENNFLKAKEISAWKENFVDHWDDIQIASKNVPEKFMHNPRVGEPYTISITLTNVGMDSGIGVELVLNFLKSDGSHIIKAVELNLVKAEQGTLTFEVEYTLRKAGIFDYSFRMFPKNPDLPHRQDLCYVRWF